MKNLTNEQRFFSNADLARLFLPIAVEQFLEYSLGLANSLMAASVSESAVSAVSLVEFVMALFISIFTAIATGGSVVASQYLGSKQSGNARNTADQLVWFSLIFAIFIALAIILLKDLILDKVFGDIGAMVRSDASHYLVFSAISAPFLAVYAAAAAIFRTMSNAKLPMYIMAAANLLNVLLTAISIYTFHTGVLGIAISTLVARAIACLVIVYLLLDVRLKLHIRKSFIYKFDYEAIKKILNIGIPYGFENSMFYLGRIIVLSLVSLFGTASIAANAVGGTIAMFQVLPGMAIGTGLSVVVARCIGANDLLQAKFYVKKSIISIYVVQIFSTAAVLLLLDPLLSIYNLSREAINLTRQIVWYHGIAMCLIWPLAYTYPTVFRAAGDAKYPMIVNLACMFACRIVLAYVFALTFDLGMIGTWFAMFADWAVKAVLFVRRYVKGTWMKFKAI
nr:MATE family efflux transporter [uncultured Campylobacter sp.]